MRPASTSCAAFRSVRARSPRRSTRWSIHRLPDRLRPLWDFDDLDASERRLREQLEREERDAGRAEVLTQLARVEGLRGDFGHAAQLLDEAEPLAGDDPAANVRLELDRWRMFR